jgi:amidase
VLALAPGPVRAAVEGAGLEIVGKTPPLPDLAAWTAAFRLVQAHEGWQEHGAWLAAHPGAVAEDVRLRFEAGRAVTPDQLDDARATLAEASAVLATVLDGSQLVLPTASSAAPLLNASPESLEADRRQTIALTSLASLAGLPAVTIPRLSVDGAPLGLCLVGAPGTDRALLEIAQNL